jgi:hypothetical protein
MTPDISSNLLDEVERELAQGERVCWIEQPIPRYFSSQSTAMMLSGLGTIALTGFEMCIHSGFKLPDFSKPGGFFSLYGLIPIVMGMGVGLLTAPLWEHRKWRKSVYVVTNRRAITFEGGRRTTVTSYTPDQLKSLGRREKKDGSGDVVLAQRVAKSSEKGRHIVDTGFLRVRDVRKTEQMLRNLTGQAPTG